MASSVNPYGKVNEAEQERLVARRNTRKRLTIIGVSSIVLVAVVVAAVVGVTQSKNGNKSRDTDSNEVHSAIRASCSVTLYPDSCYQSLAPYVKSFGNLTGVNTFLGRPWKNYSTTVYVQSMLGSFIHPNGWLPWVGTTAPDTIFYGEYQNYGAGAVTKNRVKWKGLKLNLNAKQVGKFTVKSFLKGEKWISAADVKFKSGL